MDCSAFDTYTAALATFTVDCIGTIGPDSFFVDGDGFLARRFSACTNDRTKLQSIDSILSLQRRGERLPFAAECIAGRWAEWRMQFDRLGITQCPSWQKQASIGTPTAQRIDSLAVEFTRLPARKTETALPVKSDFREDNLYAVAFEAPAPSQGCATAGECATACAAGFNGFVLRHTRKPCSPIPRTGYSTRRMPPPASTPFSVGITIIRCRTTARSRVCSSRTPIAPGPAQAARPSAAVTTRDPSTSSCRCTLIAGSGRFHHLRWCLRAVTPRTVGQQLQTSDRPRR